MPAPQIAPQHRRIGLAEIDARVRDGLHARGHAVLHELVHAPRFLGRDVLVHVEAVHLAADACTGKAETSKRVMGPMPLRPFRMASHAERWCSRPERRCRVP